MCIACTVAMLVVLVLSGNQCRSDERRCLLCQASYARPKVRTAGRRSTNLEWRAKSVWGSFAPPERLAGAPGNQSPT